MGINIGPKNYTQENLLFFIDAANPASYPGSGTSWFDISPNRTYGGNACTLGGDVVPQYSTDYGGFFFIDNNYIFNNYNSSNSPLGATGYIWPQVDPLLCAGGTGPGGAPYTLSFEMFMRPYLNGTGVGEAVILTVGDRYYVAIINPNAGTPKIGFIAAGGSMPSGGYGFVFDSPNDLFEKWHHMVFVMNANNTLGAVFSNKLYINGEEKTLTADTYPPPDDFSQYNVFDSQLRSILGYRSNSGVRTAPNDFSRMSKYDIGLFRVYKGELTQEQVTQNFESLRGRYGI